METSRSQVEETQGVEEMLENLRRRKRTEDTLPIEHAIAHDSGLGLIRDLGINLSAQALCVPKHYILRERKVKMIPNDVDRSQCLVASDTSVIVKERRSRFIL